MDLDTQVSTDTEQFDTINENADFSVVVRGMINDNPTNVMLDTGASLSVIDMGTIDHMKLVDNIRSIPNNSPKCIDASANLMQIIGTVELKVKLIGTANVIIHKFRVLNTQSSSNIIFGRDLMKKYDNIEFDFTNNRIRVGRNWLEGIKPSRQPVRLCNKVTLQPRSENVIQVHCLNQNALTQSDFVPKPIPGVTGVYGSKARIIPNIEGKFYVTLLNANSEIVVLKKKLIIGRTIPETLRYRKWLYVLLAWVKMYSSLEKNYKTPKNSIKISFK